MEVAGYLRNTRLGWYRTARFPVLPQFQLWQTGGELGQRWGKTGAKSGAKSGQWQKERLRGLFEGVTHKWGVGPKWEVGGVSPETGAGGACTTLTRLWPASPGQRSLKRCPFRMGLHPGFSVPFWNGQSTRDGRGHSARQICSECRNHSGMRRGRVGSSQCPDPLLNEKHIPECNTYSESLIHPRPEGALPIFRNRSGYPNDD